MYKDCNHQFYLDRGMLPIPVAKRSKTPLSKDWPSSQLAEVEHRFAGRPDINIGVLLGKASGNLIDIDLDSLAAVALAPFLLPPTSFSFGRKSKRFSHYVYRVDGCTGGNRLEHPEVGSTILEMRADRQFTVVPGSIHPSGESIEFEEQPGEPTFVKRKDLSVQCSLIAIRAGRRLISRKSRPTLRLGRPLPTSKPGRAAEPSFEVVEPLRREPWR